MTTSSMKLGTRLGLSFAAMLALTMAVGAFSLVRLARVNDSARETDARWIPAVAAVNDLRTAGNRVRRSEADHLMAATAAEAAGVEKKLAELNADFLKKDKLYEAMVSAGEERQAFDAYAKDRDRYYKAQAQLLELSRAGEAGGTQARAWYRGESRAAFDAMIADLRLSAAFNEKGAKAAAENVQRTYDTSFGWMLGFVGLAMTIATALGLWIVRGVRRQLGAEPVEASALASRVAEGDLSSVIHLRAGDATSMMAALQRMQDSLAAVVQQVRGGAEGVATAGAQISQGTTDLSSRTEEQAAALEQTSASMKELAGTVRRNAEDAGHGSDLAERACGVAVRGGEVVGQVVDTMRGIHDSSRRITDILSVIDGIAFQTNILALNAAVEAARAGEQGRGFAVVASEVRTLAQRSADAAKEIKALITDSVGRVEAGSALVDEAGSTMTEVVHAIREVSQIMAGISSASRQQSAGVDQVGEAVRQMDLTTQQNAALVEQSAAAADSLRSQAQQLVEAVGVFRLATR